MKKASHSEIMRAVEVLEVVAGKESLAVMEMNKSNHVAHIRPSLSSSRQINSAARNAFSHQFSILSMSRTFNDYFKLK